MQKQTTAMKVNGKENKHFSHLYGILWNQIGFNNVFQCLFSFPFLLNGKSVGGMEWNETPNEIHSNKCYVINISMFSSF